MPKKRFIPPRTRLSGFRDARLIIIASEGISTEKSYFDDLTNAYHNPRTHVKVLKSKKVASAPEYVLKQLDDFKKQYSLRVDDELWLVIDVDRWGDEKLAGIAKSCTIKRYHLAVSNRCFEIWLLFHIKSLSEYNAHTLDEFRQNRKEANRTRLEHELAILLGGYSKSNLNTHLFIPHVDKAINEAKRLDTHPEYRWPNDLGSRVYRIVEEIVTTS